MMYTSALNAEELRREDGIRALQAAFARCVSVLSSSSKADDMAVQVGWGVRGANFVTVCLVGLRGGAVCWFEGDWGLIFVLEQLQVFGGGTFCASRLVFLGAWCSSLARF